MRIPAYPGRIKSAILGRMEDIPRNDIIGEVPGHFGRLPIRS